MANTKKRHVKFKRTTKVLNWLKPTSPVKGLLLFGIVFAVVGGGFFPYKSFAASVWFTAYAPNGYICYAPDCEKVYDSHAKSPSNAVRINANKAPLSGTSTWVSFLLAHPWDQYPSWATIPTRVCASMRSVNGTSGTDAKFRLEYNVVGTYETTPFHIPGDLNYREYCTAFVNVYCNYDRDLRAIISNTSNNNDIYIASMSIQTP